MSRFIRTYRPPVFTQHLVLSDGSTITRLTTSPRPSIRSTRDLRNSTLYNPDSKVGMEDSSRLMKYREKFEGVELDDLVSDGAREAPGMSARELKESQGRKKKK